MNRWCWINVKFVNSWKYYLNISNVKYYSKISWNFKAINAHCCVRGQIHEAYKTVPALIFALCHFCECWLLLVTVCVCYFGVCRFCRGCNSLPLSLQSTAVEHRPHGLRTRVIRALFHVYRPLSERLVNHSTTTVSSHTDPQRLTGLRCIMAWQERSSKPNWKFYFKFRRGCGRLGCPLSVSSSADGGCGSSRSLLAPADVLYNPDERCILLVVTTPHFLPLPLVMGQVLVKAAVTGSIFTQSLRLIFSSEYVQPSRSDVASSVIAHFDAFASARILDWWHPNYPHRHLK